MRRRVRVCDVTDVCVYVYILYACVGTCPRKGVHKSSFEASPRESVLTDTEKHGYPRSDEESGRKRAQMIGCELSCRSSRMPLLEKSAEH